MPQKRRKRQRLGSSTTPADRLAATYPDHVWALDYQFDVTANGGCSSCSTWSTSSPGSRCRTSSATPSTPTPPWPSSTPSSGVRGVHPSFIRCDNDPELTANALRDWCRFNGAGTSYIDPGAPWQNPWVESYGARMRDELLAIEQFDGLLEAQVLVADWRTEYNDYRPHSALGMLTRVDFARQWRTDDQLQLT